MPAAGRRAVEAVALEDSAVGISAARLAGLTVIAIPESEVVDTSAAHHVAASLVELLPNSTARRRAGTLSRTPTSTGGGQSGQNVARRSPRRLSELPEGNPECP